MARRALQAAGSAIALGLLAMAGCDTLDSLVPSFGSSPPEPTASPHPPASTQPAPPPPTGAKPPPPPAAVVTPAAGSFAPGFDCNDATWCLGISASGELTTGDPGSKAGMRPVGRNILSGQANRQPRSFVVRCAHPDQVPQEPYVCRAMDSYGNVYGGNVRNPGSRGFFRLLTAGAEPADPGAAPLTPGFDCNDATWCLGVTPTGEVYAGNPNGYEGAMRPTGKNVLAGQANRQPRSFSLRCVPTGSLEDAFFCRGSDGFGSVYAGNSKNPANLNFFRQR